MNKPLHAALWDILDATPMHDPDLGLSAEQVGKALNDLIEKIQDALATHE